MIEAYKAVRVADNWHIYTLGMGKARRILMPRGVWLNGGVQGISAARTIPGARTVAGYALERKVKMRPKGIAIAKVVGSGIISQNRWRIVFKRVKLVSLVGVVP